MDDIKIMKKKKKLFLFIFTFLLTIIFIFYFTEIYAALGDPKLINKINSAFETIEGWLLKIATPAAAVAVGTGVFMKKFSFGDELLNLLLLSFLFLCLLCFMFSLNYVYSFCSVLV